MIKFTIEELKDPHDQKLLETFCIFPHQVRKAPYDVGLISVAQSSRLVLWGLYHGANFWVIRDQHSRIVLRLSLRVHPVEKQQGLIGFFEIDLTYVHKKEAFQFMIEEAQTWFKARGVKSVIAPVDLSTWFNYRFPLPSKKFFPRLKWEPTTPPEFLELFQAAGFIDYAYYNSVFFPLLKLGPFRIGSGPLKRSYEKLLKKGFSLRDFDLANFKEKEIPELYKISQEAFVDALLFDPIDLATFSELYAAGVSGYDFSPSKILLAPDGEIAGFLFAFFDGDYFVIKSVALKKKYQGLGISSGLVYPGSKIAFDTKKKYAISALVRTGLASEKMAANSQKLVWGAWTHDYALVKKDLK